MLYTRRELGKLALAGVPAATYALLKSGSVLDAAAAALAAKPNSKWAGVQVGMNVPYNFSTGNYTSGDEILQKVVQLNISGVELRAQPVELFLGSPAAVKAAAQAAAGGGRGAGRAAGRGAPPADGAATPPDAAAGAGAGGGRGGGRGAAPAAEGDGAAAPARGGRAAQTPEQQAAAKADADATKKWRMGVSMDKVKEFRKKYNDAGVNIDVVKWDGIFNFSDDEIDYAFQVSKALGANALSSEISMTPGDTKRLGSFADKHQTPVGYHGHTAVTPAIWEATFVEAKYNFANVDLGHFVGGNDYSPVPFIKQYYNRITHVHVKDKKLKRNGGQNFPFGQGDTPIKEVLQLMRDNKWKFDATIEFEYPVPAGSDRMTELAKTVQFCKDCLLS